MLPAQRGVNVVSHNAGPLSFRVHKKFSAEREVVQFVWRVVDVEKE